MSISTVLILRDLTTGAGRTGLTVKLRRKDDDFASDYAAAVEIAGKPGAYEFIDIPFNKYKLWVNGVEEKTFGGTHGKWYPVDNLFAGIELDAAAVVSGAFADARIPNLNASKITAGSLAEARLPNNINALKIAGGLITNDNFDKLYTCREYIQARFDRVLTMEGWNGIIVDAQAPDTGTMKFKTIQSAITYAHAQTPVPAADNKYTIWIMPNPAGPYTENLTLQPHINLIGIGFPEIRGTITGSDLTQLIDGVKFLYGGNYSVSQVRALNSVFKIENDDTAYQLSFADSMLFNCGMFNVGTDEFKPPIVSAGGNKFFNCVSNSKVALQASDRGAVPSLEDYTVFF